VTAATALTELAVTWQTCGGTFAEAGGLGQSGLPKLLELELLNRADVPYGSWGPWGVRPIGLAAILFRLAGRAGTVMLTRPT
jgi:hypothetical protein